MPSKNTTEFVDEPTNVDLPCASTPKRWGERQRIFLRIENGEDETRTSWLPTMPLLGPYSKVG
jgi:hypothetical protein